MWQKGQSGNPKGRQSGRKELGDAFIRVLKSDWETHGAQAVIDMRKKDPVAYVRVVAAMLPEQVEHEVGEGLAFILSKLGSNADERAGNAPAMEEAGPVTVCH